MMTFTTKNACFVKVWRILLSELRPVQCTAPNESGQSSVRGRLGTFVCCGDACQEPLRLQIGFSCMTVSDEVTPGTAN